MPGIPFVCAYLTMHTDGTVTTLELQRGTRSECEKVADGEPSISHLLPQKPVAAGHFAVRLAVEWDALMREIPGDITSHLQAGTA